MIIETHHGLIRVNDSISYINDFEWSRIEASCLFHDLEENDSNEHSEGEREFINIISWWRDETLGRFIRGKISRELSHLYEHGLYKKLVRGLRKPRAVRGLHEPWIV